LWNKIIPRSLIAFQEDITMKLAGSLLVIFALFVGIVPQFYSCQAQGREPLKLESGRTVPMKCYWTSQAELAVAAPLAVVGASLFLSKRRESQRVLSLIGLVLGLFAVLLPTALIGVCMSDEMLCNVLMKPTLIAAGLLGMGVSTVVLVRSWTPERKAYEAPAGT
jgi:hypothetical protein